MALITTLVLIVLGGVAGYYVTDILLSSKPGDKLLNYLVDKMPVWGNEDYLRAQNVPCSLVMNIYIVWAIGIILGAVVGWIVAKMLQRGTLNEGFSIRTHPTCLQAHKPRGFNQIWLHDTYGNLVMVEHEYPIGSGNWNKCDSRFWNDHCRRVSHRPKELLGSHIDAYLNPATRYCRLRYTFWKNGEIYTMEPDENFFELEQRWFLEYTKIPNGLQDHCYEHTRTFNDVKVLPGDF